MNDIILWGVDVRASDYNSMVMKLVAHSQGLICHTLSNHRQNQPAIHHSLGPSATGRHCPGQRDRNTPHSVTARVEIITIGQNVMGSSCVWSCITSKLQQPPVVFCMNKTRPKVHLCLYNFVLYWAGLLKESKSLIKVEHSIGTWETKPIWFWSLFKRIRQYYKISHGSLLCSECLSILCNGGTSDGML